MLDGGRQEPGGLDPKPFDGVRFVLLGFDYDTQSEVRLKLVSGGGEDIGSYSPDCTHVIVDKCVYDDPTCVAARSDGKILVTGLWVDHSYDIGMPVDQTTVIYRPLKDLNGIPGAKDLVMCLTGYTRQDRDDIMIMVGLMGAQFSKPLVASKATHLICYKFEGEKYELAKKLPKIKIVNHRWLEDCLSSWELLPEENYAKSGYELEMEAEAKDSEEENVEGSTTKQINGRNIKVSFDTRVETGALSTLRSIQAISKIPSAQTAMDGISYTDRSKVLNKDNQATHTPAECNNNIDLVTDGRNSVNVVKHEPGNQSPEFRDAKEGPELICPGIIEKSDGQSPTPWKEKKSALTYPSCSNGSANKLSDSGSKSSDTLTYATKTSRGLSLRKDLLGEKRYSDEKLCKLQTADALGSVSKTEQKNASIGTDTPMETSGLSKEVIANVQPSKRKLDNTFDKTKEPKSSCVSKSPIVCNDNSDVTPPASGMVIINRSSPGKNGDSLDAQNLVDSSEGVIEQKQKHIVTSSPGLMPAKSKNPRNAKLSAGDKQKTKSKPIKNAVSGKSSSSGLNLEAGSRSSYAKKAEDLTNMNPLNSENGNLKSKPGRKKGLGKKVTGSNLNSEAPSHSAELGKSKEPDMFIDESNKHKATTPSIGTRVKSVAKAISKKCSLTLTKNASVEASNKKDNGDTHDAFQKFNNTKMLRSAINGLAMERVDGEFKKDFQGKDGEAEAEAQERKDEFEAMATEAVMEDRETESYLQQWGTNYDKNTDKTLAFPEVVDNNVNGKEKGSQENEVDRDGMKIDAKRGKTNKGTKTQSKSGKHAKTAAGIKKGHNWSERITAGNKDPLEVGSMVERTLQPPNSNAQIHKVDANKLKDVLETEKENRFLSDYADNGNMDERTLQPPTSNAQKHADDAYNLKNVSESEKENIPLPDVAEDTSFNKEHTLNAITRSDNTPFSGKRKASVIRNVSTSKVTGPKLSENVLKYFLLSGHRLQTKELKKIIRQLKGRLCRDSHHWSYQATHFIVPEPLRTEKFFAAAASGRWILKPDYLTESLKAGKFLEEEPYEWKNNDPGQVGKVDLVAPRKWRILRERTGHGAFHGMRIIVYGDFFIPPLDTLKRVVKAGDGTILATAPPYTRFLDSGVDFAIISQGMPEVDVWVQEFLKHEIPCVLIDYLVEFVCNPCSSLKKHVLLNTESWAEKSFANLVRRSEEIVEDLTEEDLKCCVCGFGDRGEQLLICGDENGCVGCGIGTHVDCCDPPLKEIPEDDWLCSKCSSTNSRSKKKLKSGKANKKTSSIKKSS
ncbi:unnamed protein product [Rhodiola kirilowii]